MLIQYRANPDMCDSKGWTPLHNAAAKGDLGFVELLISAGADHTIKNAEGLTPLEIYLKNTRSSGDDLLLYLLKNGVSLKNDGTSQRSH